MNETINIIQLKEHILQALYKKHRNKATEILARAILATKKIYTTRDDVKSEMWIYENGIYIPQGKTYIREFSRKILDKAYTPQVTNLVIAKIEADTYIDQEQFFNNIYVEEIPLQNGILNIYTRELKPFTPEKIFFNKLPVKYDPKAKCPNIKKFFKDVLRDESDSKVMFEIAGFGLLKDYRWEKAFMFSGGGRNGKGKSILLLKHLVGPENTCAVPIQNWRYDSFSLSELHNKLFNLAGDLSNADFKDTGVFKTMTGRDFVNGKRKFLRDIRFVNFAKAVFACNELPRVYDYSKGFWSRWILIDFPYEFVPKNEFEKLKEEERKFKKIMDTKIIDKLITPGELSGFLNEALNGLERLQEQDNFSYTKGTAEIKDMWIRRSDSFMSFCLDCLQEDSNKIITKSDLRKSYHKYCKFFNVKGSSDKSIKVTLQELFGASEERSVLTSGGPQEYAWEGISFKSCDCGKCSTCYSCYGFNTYMKNTLFGLRGENGSKYS